MSPCCQGVVSGREGRQRCIRSCCPGVHVMKSATTTPPPMASRFTELIRSHGESLPHDPVKATPKLIFVSNFR